MRRCVHISSQRVFVVQAIARPYLNASRESRIRAQIERQAAVRGLHVAGVVDFYEDREYLYSIYDTAGFVSAQDWVASQVSYPEAVARRLVLGALKGLEAIHAANAVHGTLRLSSLLVGRIEEMNGADEQVRVGELDNMTTVEPSAALSGKHTRNNSPPLPFVPSAGAPAVPASPGFESPEYLLQGVVSQPGDMWALGVIAFMLLSGLQPFRADSQVHFVKNALLRSFSLPTSLEVRMCFAHVFSFGI